MMWRGEYTRSGLRKIIRLEEDKERYPRGMAIQFEARDDQVTAAKEILAFLNTNFPLLGFNADDIIASPLPEPNFDPIAEDNAAAAALAEPDDEFLGNVQLRSVQMVESAGGVVVSATHEAVPDIEIRGKLFSHSFRSSRDFDVAEASLGRRMAKALWAGRVRGDD